MPRHSSRQAIRRAASRRRAKSGVATRAPAKYLATRAGPRAGVVMSERIRVVSPADGRIVAERALAQDGEIAAMLARARTAQASWRGAPLAERQRVVSAFVDAFEARGPAIAEEITLQMGRPIAHSPGEIRGLAERARAMTALAPEALADVVPPPKPDFTRFVRREPLGVVLVI